MSNTGSNPIMSFTVDDETTAFIGKHLLVGITQSSKAGVVTSREQFHGIITRINQSEGIVIKLHGSDKERSIPADISQLQLTPPGEYRLTGTGEVVEDPDYTLKLILSSKG